MDFQSIALPPELRYLDVLSDLGEAPVPKSECKGTLIFFILQIFPRFFARILKKSITFALAKDEEMVLHRWQSGCSAVGSALRSGRRGRAFESPHPDFKQNKRLVFNRLFAFIAQLVAQKSDTNIMGWLSR